MRSWMKSLAIGFLVAEALLTWLPVDTLAIQPAEPQTFGSVEAKGSIYVTSSLGLHAVDVATGTERWRVATPTPASSYPTFADGIVFFIAASHPPAYQAAVVHAVDATGGQELWSFEFDGILPKDARGMIGPVVVNAHKAYLFDSARFFVLDAQAGAVNGQPLATGMQAVGTTILAAHENLLLLADRSRGVLACVDLPTGEQRWTAPVATDSFHAVYASETTALYLVDEQNVLVALDWTTGAQLWRVAAGTAATPRFIHATGEELVLGGGSGIAGIGSADGSTRWQIDLPTGSVDDAVVRDMTAFVATDERMVAAIDVATRTQTWSMSIGTRVNTLGFDASGNLVVLFYGATPGGHSEPAPDLMLLDPGSGSPIWTLTLEP